MTDLEMVNELIKIAEFALADNHNSSTHHYVDDPNRLGMCAICGWMKKRNVLRNEVQKALEKLRIIRVVLENGSAEQIKPFEQDLIILKEMYESRSSPGYNYISRN